MTYNEARDTFAQMVFDQKCNGQSPCGYVVEGKKRDRLFLFNGQEKAKVEFFINRSTGLIEHAKSNTIHNTNRPYGTVYNAHKWSWAGKGGTNVSDETFVDSGSSYNGYKHYLPVGVTKPPRKVRAKKATFAEVQEN